MPRRNLIWLLAIMAAALAVVWYCRSPALPPAAEPDRGFAALRAARRLAKEHYYLPMPEESAEQGALRGYLEALDPYCRYVPPDKADGLETIIHGRRTSVGLRCAVQDGQAVVVGPVYGSPAHRRGIQAGDILLAIGEQPLVNPTIEQVEALLDAPAGHAMSLTLRRDDAEHVIRLESQTYEIETVVGLLRGPDGRWRFALDEPVRIGYVRIREFATLTPENLDETLRLLAHEGEALAALVLDLRGNPGGPLPQAVGVADRFIDSGLIVATQGRDGISRHMAHRDRTYASLPLAVLVDERTASAAELVAGALKEHGRAVLVGQTTMGKDLAQRPFSLGDGLGEVMLTTSRYFFREPTEDDLASPPGRGVRPHVEVVMSAEASAALEQRWQLEDVVPPPSTAILPVARAEEEDPPSRLAVDAQLAEAVRLLTDADAYKAATEAAELVGQPNPAE